jgi:peptide deformylase
LTSTAVIEAKAEGIGVKKQIIAVNMGMFNVAMINPVITMKSGSYQTEEGCLSLVGMRPATRYKEIEVEYFDAMWKKQKQKYSGMIAQRIQHEIDHLSGIII